MNYNLLSGVVIAVSILGGFYIKGLVDTENALTSSIRVEGRAEEEVQADAFDWSFRYEFVGDSIQAVKENCKQAKKAIIGMLNKYGLERDVDFVVYPKSLSNGRTDDGKSTYTISQKYSIKTANIEAAKKVFESEELVANNITVAHEGSGGFIIKDTVPLELKLKTAALKDGPKQAKQCAAEVGCEIVGAPEICWSSIRITDANASSDSWWDSRSIDKKPSSTSQSAVRSEKSRWYANYFLYQRDTVSERYAKAVEGR